jgi:hypothetical protein
MSAGGGDGAMTGVSADHHILQDRELRERLHDLKSSR